MVFVKTKNARADRVRVVKWVRLPYQNICIVNKNRMRHLLSKVNGHHNLEIKAF